MAKKRKSAAGQRGLLLQKLLFHPATWFVGVTVMLVLGAVHTWEKYGNQFIAPQIVAIQPEQIEITPQPAWTRVDLREELAGDQSAPLSLLDPHLIPASVAHLKSVGWIESVRHIDKTVDGLNIDVAYRQPVASVELNDNTVPDWGQTPRQMPIDSSGLLMPAESLPADDGLLISMFHSIGKPAQQQAFVAGLRPYSQWPDSRVADAAAIAAWLQADAAAMGLKRIVTFRYAEKPDDVAVPYEIWTSIGQNGPQFIWGNPPGGEQFNEAQPPVKLAALRAWFAAHGDATEAGEQVIDLRTGSAVIVGAKQPSVGRRNRSPLKLK